MPIAKYVQNLYPVTPPPPPEPEQESRGGGGFYPPDENDVDLALFDYVLDGRSAEEASNLAYELGQDTFIPGKPISINQFAWRAYNFSSDAPNRMHEVLIAIDEGRAIAKKERAISIAKYTVVIGGITYVLYRIIPAILL